MEAKKHYGLCFASLVPLFAESNFTLKRSGGSILQRQKQLFGCKMHIECVCTQCTLDVNLVCSMITSYDFIKSMIAADDAVKITRNNSHCIISLCFSFIQIQMQPYERFLINA